MKFGWPRRKATPRRDNAQVVGAGLGTGGGVERRLEGVVAQEGAREIAGGAFADVADAESEQQAFERDGAAGFDGAEQVVDGFFAEAVAIFEATNAFRIAGGQGEDVGWAHDAAFVVEGFDLFAAEAFDVEGETGPIAPFALSVLLEWDGRPHRFSFICP